MLGDTPIELVDITKMPNEQIDALILNIRERRLAPIKAYNETQLLKEQARIAGLSEKLNKQCEMFKKELERVDNALDKIEKRALNIRALRLEIED